MLIQLTEKLFTRGTLDPRYEVCLSNGAGEGHAIILNTIPDGVYAINYVLNLASILGCDIQYSYEQVTLRICTIDELKERIEY